MCVTFFCFYPFRICRKQNHIENNSISTRKRTKLNQQETLCNNIKHKPIKKINKSKKENGFSQKKWCQVYEQKQQQNYKEDNEIKFIIAFNRDEQVFRKTLPMGPYDDDPNIYAGRDSKSKGTWLGINIKTGLMVILTNYDLPVFRHGKSRGQLVKSFLNTTFVPTQILSEPQLIDKKIQQQLIEVIQICHNKQYAAFNLLVYNIRSDNIYYICSQKDTKVPILLQRNKIYGLCNTDLFNIWPKTEHGLQLFQDVLGQTKNKKDEQILQALVNEVMKDKKTFSKNPNDQASIFIEPFYSTLQNAERMTKSTFVALIKDVKNKNQQSKYDKKVQLIIKEITHINTVDLKLQKQKDYDHKQELTVDYKFII